MNADQKRRDAITEWNRQQSMDLIMHGIHITKGGNRIDPLDFYAEPLDTPKIPR